MNKSKFYNWLAGFIDGDGCFTISLHANGSSLHIGFSVTVGVKYNDKRIIKYIKDNIKVGNVYVHKEFTDDAKVTWQTTNLADSIYVTKKVLPYLQLKNKKAEKFLECAQWYLSTCRSVKGKRSKGKKIRTNKQMKRVVKTALEINYDRQVRRYRSKKPLEFWYKYINKYFTM